MKINESPVWHPFTQHGLGEAIPLVVEAAGAALFTADGRRIVDAVSSWWVTTHGHRHPRIMAAIREQASHLDQIIFAGFTHPAAEAVARGVVALTAGALPRLFFSDSGSTAVEVALKMALGYWLAHGRPRHRILTLEHGYHGDTIGTMSVGARGVYNRAYQPLLFEVEPLPFPQREGEVMLDRLEQACRRGDVAALIVEPLLLGAGGMRLYAPAVLRSAAAICAGHGVLLIADEVLTGWGRTGTLFACQHAGIWPDILCLSKGLTGGSLPLAVTLAREPIYEAHLSTDRARMLFHSSSYTANPIACAAAAANLAIWNEEPVRQRIDALAAAQAERLAALPATVRNRRQIGTVTAFELGSGAAPGYLSDLGPRLMAFFLERDVLLRPMGDTVYVMPPYCIEPGDLDRVYSVIAQAADRFAGQ
jgi:adenosylmethionine-8-amino-7-oxononanoate aminotransferase